MVDVVSVIRNEAQDVAWMFDQKDVFLELAVPLAPVNALVEMDDVRRIVQHLLLDAVRSSAPGGHVRLELTGQDGGVTLRTCGAGNTNCVTVPRTMP